MAPYDSIASEYYDDFHITCRNFDQTTIFALRSIKSRVPQTGLVLDAGAGRGRCKEFLDIGENRIVQLDSSPIMLQLQPREGSLIRIIHSAESLPFTDNSFTCITAFLCDAFIGLNFLAEAFRVLKEGGVLIGTIPSFEWGFALRQELSIDLFQTRFITKSGKVVTLPSILVQDSQLIDMLKVAGFHGENMQVTKHRLPQNVAQISEDIKTPAKNLGSSVHDLDIVYLFFAGK